MSMYFWKFKLHGWSEVEGHYTHEGLIYGKNFTEAVDNLENHYYNEIEDLYIEPVGCEGDPYLFSEQYEINEGEVVTDDSD